MPSESKPFTVEALERERQARLKEAVAGEPANKGKAEKRDLLQAQIAKFQKPIDADSAPTCKSYAAAEALIIKYEASLLAGNQNLGQEQFFECMFLLR